MRTEVQLYDFSAIENKIISSIIIIIETTCSQWLSHSCFTSLVQELNYETVSGNEVQTETSTLSHFRHFNGGG